MSVDSASDYESWVRGLRAWREDPLTDLSHLPVLEETSFPPSVYERFIRHLNDEVNQFMKKWQQQFTSQLEAAKDEHERGRALVRARTGLAARVALARHPALPDFLRAQLERQAADDIRGLQDQLEKAALQGAGPGGTSNRALQEANLRVVRRNPLTAVLDPHYAVVGPVSDHELLRASRTEHEMLVAPAPTDNDAYARSRPIRRIFGSDRED